MEAQFQVLAGMSQAARRGVCFFILLALQTLSAGSVYCVSPQGDDSNSGESWQEPLYSVQSALRRAGPGAQVWVAAGIYQPQETRVLDASLTLATSFVLTDGVQLLGGFAGYEESPVERQRFDRDNNGVVEAWEFTHETILQGSEDLDGTVLWGGQQDFLHAVLIDGFTISGGRALGFAQDGQGGGALLPGNCVLQNCLLTGNLARQGGGVALLGPSTVRNCAVVDNEVAAEGSLGCGGGVLLAAPGAVLSNSLVQGNCRLLRGACRGGGGVAGTAGTAVKYCTIVENYAEEDGSGICFSEAAAQMHSSVIWGNVGPGAQIRLGGAQCRHCAVQDCSAAAGILPLAAENCGANGVAVNDNTIAALYPCFRDPARGDYRLGAGSYLINRGRGESAELDAANNPRPQNETADIGCYETPERGNLTADFGVEMPLLYARLSQVQTFWGLDTPAGVSTVFSHRLAQASWQQSAGQDFLFPESVSEIELELRLELEASLAENWNPLICRKILPVQPRPLYIAAEDVDWHWGSPAPQLPWRLLAGSLAEGDRLQGELACPPITGLGTYPILQGTLEVAGAGQARNYRLVFIPGELRCLPGLAEVHFEGESQLVYNGLPQGLTVKTFPPGLTLEYIYTGTGQTNYPASTEVPREAGTYQLTARVQDELYVGSGSTSLSILPAPLVCQALDQEKVYLAENPQLEISFSGFQAGDGLESIVPPQAQTTAELTSPVRAEGYPITLQGGQADSYQLILRNGTLRVRPAQPQILALESVASVYGTELSEVPISGRAVHPLTGQSVAGHFFWEAGNGIPNAGTSSQGWVFMPDDQLNYLPAGGSAPVSILPRPVQVTADSRSKVYGDAEPALTYRITQGSLLAGDDFAGVLMRTVGEEAGSYVIAQGTLNLSDNYQLDFIAAEFRIEPRQLTVIADNLQKYYSQPDPVLTYQIGGQGLVAGDVLTGALQREPGEELGEYAILQGDLQSSANYQLSFLPGQFTILKPVLKLRDEPETVVLTYGQPLSGELLHSVVVVLESTGEEIPGHFVWEDEQLCLPCGSHTGRWHFLPDAAEDYPPLPGSSEIQVLAAPLLVRMPDYSREYGQENPQFELEFSGFVLQEDCSVLLAVPEVNCGADRLSLPGEYPIEISGGEAANYELIFENGMLTVKKILLTVHVPSQSKQYGDPDPVLESVCQSGLLEGDRLSGAPGRVAGEMPGEYEFTAGTLSLPPYYELVLTGGVFRILPRQLTIKADDVYPLYGESIPPFTYTIVEGTLLPGDSISGELECWYNKRDRDFPINIGSLNAGENYQINFVPGIFHFRKRTLTITALDCSKEYLSPDNYSRSWQITAGSLVENDYLAVKLGREPGEEIGQYALILASLTVIPAELYEITFVPGTFSIVRASPGVGVCTYHLLYYGDQLAKSNLTAEMRNPNNSMIILGEAQWLEPERLMDAVGRIPCEFMFTPVDQEHFAPTVYSIDVQVLPLQVTVSGPQMELIYGEPLPSSFAIQTVPAPLPFGEQFLGELGFAAGKAGDILPPGQYPFSVGTLQAPSENYRWNFSGGTLTVSKRPLTIQALDGSKYVGEEDPPLQYQIVSGSLLPNDSFTGTLRRKSGQKVGEYQIRIGTLSAGKNYRLNFLPGVFRILEPELEPAAAPAAVDEYILDSVSVRSIVYGQALWESELTGQVLAAASQEPQAGSFSWLEPELRPSAGIQEYAWRYVCSDSNRTLLTGTARLEVLPATLHIDGWIQKKQPGQPDPALGWSFAAPSAALAALPCTGSPGRSPGENPGRYDTTPGNLSFGPNYQLDFRPGALIITAATVAVDSAWQGKLYEGEEIILGERQFHYGRDAFASLQQALESVSPGGEIFLFPGEYHSEQQGWTLPAGLLLSAWPGQEQAVILQGQLRVESGAAENITVRGLTIMAVDGRPAVQFEAAEDCCLEDNLILGGQPAVVVKEARGLRLSGNSIVSDGICLLLGDADEPGREMTGVQLQQNHFAAAGADLSHYWHLQIHAGEINGNGVLNGSGNYYFGLLLQQDSPEEEISSCKEYIGDGDCPQWPVQSVLKFLQ